MKMGQLFGFTIAVMMVGLVMREWPEVQRYLKMRSM